MAKHKLPELIVPNVTPKSWNNGAFTIAFLVSTTGNMVLKGYFGDIEEYLKTINGKYFCKCLLYPSSIWRERSFYICSNGLKIAKPSYKGRGRYYYTYRIYKNFNDAILLKRLPNHWIPEFDTLISSES